MRRYLVGLAVLCGCSGEIAGPVEYQPAGGSGGSSTGSGAGRSGASQGSGASGSGGASSRAGSGGASPGTGGSAASTTTGGTSGSAGDGDPAVAPVTFSCDPALVPKSPPLRRLTRVQYENTVRDLLTFALGDREDALAVESSLASSIAALPPDERPKTDDPRGSYRRLDQGVAQSHVDGWYNVGARVGAELSSAANLERVVGECAGESSGVASCVDDFIRNFGARALRRPLSNDEVDFYRGFYGTTSTIDPAGFADVIAGLMSAPEFVYHIESGAEEVAGQPQAFALSAYELASRLSYHFWNTLPDQELWEKAEDASLLDTSEYQRQVDRLFTDSRSKAAARDFYREWLKLEELPPLDEANGVAIYDAFTGDDRPTSMLAANMSNEVLDLLHHLSWQEPAGLDQLLTTQLIFPKTDDLASLYGVDATDEPVLAPSSQRPGLFTRAAFLATGSERTRPIKKGVFMRENVLCDHIEAPPANAQQNLPDLDPALTTRQMVEAITESGSCAGCHLAYINDLGFPFEAYDALGRYRTSERMFDDEGEVIATEPVNTRSMPQIHDGDETEVANAAELMDLVVASNKAPACLARHYFRYSFGRWENVAADGCALEHLRTTLVDSNTLSAMLREVALAPEFRRRTIQE
jgi:hypothetical protein